MEKPTNYLKILVLFCLMCMTKIGFSQTPCSASLSAFVGSGGNASFYCQVANSTSNVANSYSWNYGNGAVASGTGMSSGATTYTANGTYTISVTYTSATAGCTATATQTINVINANGCGLVPQFVSSVAQNGLANFTSNSQNVATGATFTWKFGDGSPNGSGPIVAHTYASTGTNYLVKLIINNNSSPACMDSTSNSVYICPPPATITSTINANGVVTFSASVPSTSVTNSSWIFGDNTGFFYNIGTNPTHTYLANGNYSVSFLGGVGQCSSTVIYSLNVANVVAPCNLSANFNSYVQPAGATLFSNTTVGASGSVSYLWNFGDGSPTSSVMSPTHSYAANGSYMVTLSANNNYSYACTSTQTAMVTVGNICNVIPGFNFTIGANGGVSFANTTSNTTPGTMSYFWYFGDNTFSTLMSPSHNYANGSYNVTMQATRTNGTLSTCSNSVTQVVTVTTCVADASFSMTPTGTPQFWNAYPLVPSMVTAAIWNWGDNSTSSTLYTTHTYSAAGSYDICLTVTVSCGTVNMYCMPYAIYRSSGASQENEVIQVTVIDPATVGIKNSSSEKIDYTISPNPNNGSFQLNMKGLNSDKANVSIYNIVGTVVYQADVETSNGNSLKEVQLDQVANGVYFVKVSANNKVYTQKLIINKQ